MKTASILGNLGVHIIQYPTGRWGFVGTIPAALGDVVLATTADIMAGRAETNPHDGKAYTLKFPSFETRADAEAYQAAKLETPTDEQLRSAYESSINTEDENA